MRGKLRMVAGVLGLGVLVMLAWPALAGAVDKITEVVVRNTDNEPVPTKAIGTTPVSGTVSVAGTAQVAGSVGVNGTVPITGQVGIAGEPTVRIGPTRAYQEYMSHHTEPSSVCESSLQLNNGSPILVKKLYVDLSEFLEAPPSVEIRATVITHGVWPDHVVQTFTVASSNIENGHAVFDFGDTGLYLDDDRSRARPGDAVALYLTACQHHPDAPHEIRSWQGLAVGYVQ